MFAFAAEKELPKTESWGKLGSGLTIDLLVTLHSDSRGIRGRVRQSNGVSFPRICCG